MFLVKFMLMLLALVDDSILHTCTREQKAMPIFVERHLVGGDALNHVGECAVDEVNVIAKVMSG